MEIVLVVIIIAGIAALGWGISKMLNQPEAELPTTVADLKVKESSAETKPVVVKTAAVKKPRKKADATDSKGKASAPVPTARKNTTVKKAKSKKAKV